MPVSLAISIDRSPASDALALRHAYFGFQLHAVAPSAILDRLNERTTLLTRLEGAVDGLLGAGRAIEVRCVVWPANAANGWQERIDCYLLARYSAWGLERSALRARAAAFAAEMRHLLAHTLPGYSFVPLTALADLALARAPFPLTETGEVRRRLPESPAEPRLPLPFLGVPSVEAAVEIMARQAHPSLLAVCVAPATLATLAADDLTADASDVGDVAGPAAAIGALRRHDGPAERGFAESVTRVYDDVAYLQRQARRLATLRQRAFQLRVQLASPAPLGEALITTLLGECGGPGTHTAQSVWQDPSVPIAAGALWERPRSSRPRGGARTEEAVARANLSGLFFAPWGEGGATPAGAGWLYLADVSEAARLLPLPGAASWLPSRGHTLPLPLVGATPTLSDGVRLGHNPVRGVPRPVMLPTASRAQHLWILGKPGTGKSTLLETMILQDIRAGHGAIVIDPHGDLIEQILGKIPTHRAGDVILFDPADTEHPVGINPLEATTDAEKALVVSSFLGLLKKIFDPLEQGIVGPRFEHGVRNGMLTVMSRPGATLVEFMRVLTDDAYLRTLLPHVTDPIVRRYWTDQIARTSDFHRSEVLDYTVSKFGRWVTDPTIRRIVGQSRSSFSFRAAMDSGKIVLLSLAKGRVGGDNANFLGLILLPKILQAALSRVGVPERERRDVTVYIDEFHNYATDALSLMLAEARKYHVALVLANQHIEQLAPDIRNAVIGNAGSIISFRVGLKDAAALEEILAPGPIAAHHLSSLPNYTAYARLLVGGEPTPAFTLATEPVGVRRSERRAERVRALSRKAYGRPVAEVDAEMNRRADLEPGKETAHRPRKLGLVVPS